MKRELTGWHVLGGFVVAFGIIISVNLVLAFQAVATFPGLVVKNSYVASQNFDAERAAQDALGWDVSAQIISGVLTLNIQDKTGKGVNPAQIKATLGRATHVSDDVIPTLNWDGQRHSASVDIEPGYWTLWVNIIAEDGTKFRRRIPILVKDDASP